MSIGTVERETRGGVDPMSIAEEFLAFEEDHLEARSEGFRIDSDAKAEWAVRKIRQAQTAIEERRAFVQAQIEVFAFPFPAPDEEEGAAPADVAEARYWAYVHDKDDKRRCDATWRRAWDQGAKAELVAMGARS